MHVLVLTIVWPYYVRGTNTTITTTSDFVVPAGVRDFLFTKAHRPVMEPHPGVVGTLSVGVKQQVKFTTYLPLSPRSKMSLDVPARPPCVFVARTSITLPYQLVFKRHILLPFYFKILFIFLGKFSFFIWDAAVCKAIQNVQRQWYSYLVIYN